MFSELSQLSNSEIKQIKTMNIKNLLVPVAFAVATVIVSSCSSDSKVTYNTSKVVRQNISTGITATGTIEPVTEVEVGTQVSGLIDKIYVDFNSEVHKGDIIAELDKSTLLSTLASAMSNLSNAQSDLTYQTSNYNRYKTLYEKGLVSADDYESAKLSYEQAKQTVAIQQESVTTAKTNLGYATITAPIDGIVLSKEVEEGQTVAASMETPTLFIIAKDLTDMRVIADVDEADIGEVKEGQRVTFTVDAFPDDVFEGEVTQVRQEATTTDNVVTYEVVISAPNDDLKLKPGLTANVTVFTSEKNNVIAVPAKALTFTPNENMLTEEEKIVDCDGEKKVWVRDGNNFKAIAVTVGVTDGTNTEILSGLQGGEKVITDFTIGGSDTSAEEEASSEETESNPFMPSPPGKKSNSKK